MNLAEPARSERFAGWLALNSYRPEYARQVQRLAGAVFERAGIAEFFEVDGATLDGWRTDHADFACAMDRGAVLADVNVAAALYRTAIGHERTETRTVAGRTTSYTVHVPPNVRACMYWLERRCPEQWSARSEVRVDAGYKRVTLTID